MTPILEATALSATAAAAATLLVVPLGVPIAWALARRRFVGQPLVEVVVALPLVVPPSAVGLVLLLALGRRGPIGGALHRAFGIDVAFTFAAVVVAGAVMALPLFVRTLRAAFEEVDPRYVGLARSLGRGPWRAFVSVELPLVWRGLAAAATLAFARALGEFGATILVAGSIPGATRTLALGLFHEVQRGDDRAALAYAAVSAALAFTALLAVELLSRRRARRLES